MADYTIQTTDTQEAGLALYVARENARRTLENQDRQAERDGGRSVLADLPMLTHADVVRERAMVDLDQLARQERATDNVKIADALDKASESVRTRVRQDLGL